MTYSNMTSFWQKVRTNNPCFLESCTSYLSCLCLQVGFKLCLAEKLENFPGRVLWKLVLSLCGLRRAEITLQILQESVRIIDVFSTALHPRYASFVYEWTANCALSTNSKTFQKNSKKITKYLLQPRSVFACADDIAFTSCPFKNLRGGGLIWRRLRRQRLQKISNFSAL